jgi:hypothetical protein
LEIFEGNEFPVERLVIPFDLTSAKRVVWPAEDKFDTVFLSFGFEHFGDELFSIIDIDLSRDPTIMECLLQGINS